MSIKNTRRGFDFNRPTVIALLYLGSILIQFSFIIGLVMAMVWTSQPHEEWEESHFSFHIRTFLMMLGACVAAGVGVIASVFISPMPILLPMMVAAATVAPILLVWLLVRIVRSLTLAQRQEAIPRHKNWFFR